jgi:hypothetical protein
MKWNLKIRHLLFSQENARLQKAVAKIFVAFFIFEAAVFDFV